jgi:hypothetical protein
MANIATRWAAVVVSLAACAATGRADDPKGGARPENQLVGTWKLVSAKYGGSQSTLPERVTTLKPVTPTQNGWSGSMLLPDLRVTTLKHVTPTQFMWASYDTDGKVTRAAGGGYTLKGEAYEETPEYGFGLDFVGLKGKVQSFTWKVEGNKWYHAGKLNNRLTIEEVWERVEKK